MTADYRLVFVAVQGLGPWACYGCGKPVTKLFVHHLDEDPTNNAPENLVAMHRGCHVRLHRQGKPRPPLSAEQRKKIGDAQRGRVLSAETRQKIATSMTGKTRSAETRQKIADAQRGKIHSAETRQRISAAAIGRPHPRRRVRCGECDVIIDSSGLWRHQRRTGHSGRHELVESA